MTYVTSGINAKSTSSEVLFLIPPGSKFQYAIYLAFAERAFFLVIENVTVLNLTLIAINYLLYIFDTYVQR